MKYTVFYCHFRVFGGPVVTVGIVHICGTKIPLKMMSETQVQEAAGSVARVRYYFRKDRKLDCKSCRPTVYFCVLHGFITPTTYPSPGA